jgi:nitroimidazol reductase NimA-like FMN-containing flavoprotein (pyridoxamine 5'-phosphate oxidase superfamily)
MATLLDEAPGRGFEALDEEECFNLLHEGHFGRVAVSVGAIPAVFPVNYCALNGAIYFFTAEGTKLAAATRETVVAFEIDHCNAVYHEGWSVLAVGVAREVHEPVMHELVRRLPLDPWAPGSRGHLVRVWPDFVSGRRITCAAVPSTHLTPT